MKTKYLYLLMLMSISFPILAEQAEELEKQGKDLLRSSQADQSKLVPAAKTFILATAMYESQGNLEKAVEMNSYLYWCKKKMNINDINNFTKAAGVASTDKLQAIEKLETKPDDSKAWFTRVEEFARIQPEEHFLIAVRYFEVADRFKGTDISLKAQELSLQSMQKTAPKISNIPPVEPPKQVIAGRLPVPGSADIKKAEKAVGEIYGAETSKTAQGDLSAVAQKILSAAKTSNDEPGVQYVLFKLASEMAARGGSIALVVQSAEAMGQRFEIDSASEKVAGLQKIPTTDPDVAMDVFDAIIGAMESAKNADAFESLASLSTLAQSTSVKTNLGGARTVAARYSAHAKEIARDLSTVKTAWERWKTTPEDPTLNLTIGKFYAFLTGDWNRGLAALARCSDPALKALAEQELSPNNEAGVLMAVADQWWDYAEKQKGAASTNIKLHAGKLYKSNLESATALTKVRAQKRLDSLGKVSVELIGGKEDVTGVYAGAHPEWKAKVAITPDGRFKKVNDGLGGTWTFTGFKLILNWDGFGAEPFYLDTLGVFKSKKTTLTPDTAKK